MTARLALPALVSVRRSTFRLDAGLAIAVALLAAPAPVGAATIVVTTLTDSDAADADCSLREAIVAANDDAAHQGCAAGAGPDRIEFAAGGVITLGSDLPTITKDLTLAGPPLAPSGLPALTVHGDDHRLLLLNGNPNGRTLAVERLTLRNGLSAAGGGCIRFRTGDHLIVEDSRILSCRGENAGGGILGDGAASLTIRRSTIAGNVSDYDGGGLYFLGEGYEDPTVPPTASFLVEDSTIASNLIALEDAGGGVASGYANGAIVRTTISGNRASDAAGGLLVIYGLVTVSQSTITDNFADTNGDDLGVEAGGGIYVIGDGNVPATVELQSTVVGGNFMFSLASDLVASTAAAILSDGFNLIGVRDGAAAFFPVGAPNAHDDWVGSRSAPVLAGLATLADNGGPTDTHAPSPGSLLVDHGSCAGALADQRGFGSLATLRRPIDNPLVPDADDGCDIGAVEAEAVALPAAIFRDGFESDDTAAWSATTP